MNHCAWCHRGSAGDANGSHITCTQHKQELRAALKARRDKKKAA